MLRCRETIHDQRMSHLALGKCHYFLRIENAHKKVKEFHLDQISLYTQDVVGNKMSKIKPNLPKIETTWRQERYKGGPKDEK